MTAPTFLTILPEVREIIYTIHLTTPNPLPPSSVTRANRFSRRDRFPNFGWPWNKDVKFYMDDCIHYRDPTTHPVIPASLPLLLCNRQINAEVSSTIAFLTTHTKQLYYEIDCEIVNEVALYPTWLYVPIYFNEAIPCLYATFRISGQLVPEGRSDWRHGCGGPGYMVWSLMELLNRFLERGPNFIPPRVEAPSTTPVGTSSPLPSTSTHKPTYVTRKFKVLKNRIFKGGQSYNRDSVPALSITALPEPAASSTQAKLHDQSSNNIRIEKLVLEFGSEELANPEDYFSYDNYQSIKVVKFVERELDFLFSGSQSTIEYGRFIALRVGFVCLLCDGEEIAKWDLANSELGRQ